MEGNEVFEQPWDVVADFVTKRGYTLTEARDRVILAWLHDGNTDPYCDWVERGHTPSHRVALLVARMMRKAKNSDEEAVAALPCGLAVSGDGRTLPDKEGKTRIFLAVRHSIALREMWKANGKTSITAKADAEAAAVAAEVPLANNVTIGRSTVRQARMALQRSVKTGTVPDIMRGLACWE